MRLNRPAQPLSCSFCGKSQQAAQKLIGSPSVSFNGPRIIRSRRAYICDECVLDPGKLKLVPDTSVGCTTDEFTSLSSRIWSLLRNVLVSPEEGGCPFCEGKGGPGNLYVSVPESEPQVRICEDCLDVCRHILKDEGISISRH